MAEVRNILLEGVIYDIRDDTSRSLAQAAQTTASNAQSTASTAQTTANTANTTAQAAQTAATTAQTTANNAQTTASTAQSTANTANTNAQTAQTTATNAQTTATEAHTTATTAQTTATNAQSTASTAQSTANTANTNAQNAQTLATDAANLANAAQLTVDTHVALRDNPHHVTMTQIGGSNENIATNTDFREGVVVNTSGRTEWSGALNPSLDEWSSHGANTRLSLQSGFIRVRKVDATAASALRTNIKNPRQYMGKQCTLSIIYRCECENAQIAVIGMSWSTSVGIILPISSSWRLEHFTFIVPTDVPPGRQFTIQVSLLNLGVNEDLDIQQIKLELGSVSTILNDTAPDFNQHFQSVTGTSMTQTNLPIISTDFRKGFVVNTGMRNWWFGEGFTVDGWYGRLSGFRAVLNDGFMTFWRVSGQPTVRALIKDRLLLTGKRVTASIIYRTQHEGHRILILEADGWSPAAPLGATMHDEILPASTNWRLHTFSFNVPWGVPRASHMFYSISTMQAPENGPIDVERVKLELGSVSTILNDVSIAYNTEFIRETGASPTQSNNNILVNADFTNPVNTQGLSEYSHLNTSGDIINDWIGVPSGVMNVTDRITLTEDGLEIFKTSTTGSSNLWIRQYIENPQQYRGKTVTFSIEVLSASGGAVATRTTSHGLSIGSNVGNISGNIYFDNEELGIVSITADIPGNIETLRVSFCCRDNATILVRRAKLELGSISTLINDPVPNYNLSYLKTVGVSPSQNNYNILLNSDFRADRIIHTDGLTERVGIGRITHNWQNWTATNARLSFVPDGLRIQSPGFDVLAGLMGSIPSTIYPVIPGEVYTLSAIISHFQQGTSFLRLRCVNENLEFVSGILSPIRGNGLVVSTVTIPESTAFVQANIMSNDVNQPIDLVVSRMKLERGLATTIMNDSPAATSYNTEFLRVTGSSPNAVLPNILDNWDFSTRIGIVNQQGLDSYPGVTSIISRDTIDRWKLFNNTTALLTIENGFIRIIGNLTNSTIEFNQEIEYPERYSGLVTLSMIYRSSMPVRLYINANPGGNLAGWTINPASSEWRLATATMNVLPNSNILRIRAQLHPQDTFAVALEHIDIQRMELVEGSVSTLRNRTSQDFRQMLITCRRYIFGFTLDHPMSHVANSIVRYRAVEIQPNHIDFYIPIGTEMRFSPEPVLPMAPSLDAYGWTITSGINPIAANRQTGFGVGLTRPQGPNMQLRFTKNNHGLTDAILTFNVGTAGQQSRLLFDANM